MNASNVQIVREPVELTRAAPVIPQPHGTIRTEASLRVELVRDFDEAKSLRPQWDELALRSGGDVFSTFDWCREWWSVFCVGDRELRLCLGWRGEKLVGVLPLFAERLSWGPFPLRVVRLIGGEHPFSKAAFAMELADARSFLSRAFAIALDDWDVLHLGELPGHRDGFEDLTDVLREACDVGAVIANAEAYPQMVFDVPESMDAWLNSLSLKERRNVRRDLRELEANEDAADLTQDNGRAVTAVNELVRLHGEQWRRQGRLGQFGDWRGCEAFTQAVAQRLAEGGRTFIHRIHKNGALLATELSYQFGERVHWIIGGRAEGVTSRVGFAALMRSCVERGVRLIDAMGGLFDYKRRLGARVIHIKTITAIANRAGCERRWRRFRAVTAAVDVPYFRGWQWRLQPALLRRCPGWLHGALGRPTWRRYARSKFVLISEERRQQGDES